MKAPLWTYPLAALPLIAFYALVGVAVGWAVAALIFVPMALTLGVAAFVGVRRRHDIE